MTRPRLRVIAGGKLSHSVESTGSYSEPMPRYRQRQLGAFADWMMQFYGRVPPEDWPPPETWPVPPQLRAV